MGIGNFGIWELLVVGLIVLIFFGPRRLPEIARSAGKAIREFKRGVNEIQRELEIADRETRAATSTPAAPGAPGATPATSDAATTAAGSEGAAGAAAAAGATAAGAATEATAPTEPTAPPASGAPDTTTPSLQPPIPTFSSPVAPEETREVEGLYTGDAVDGWEAAPAARAPAPRAAPAESAPAGDVTPPAESATAEEAEAGEEETGDAAQADLFERG